MDPATATVIQYGALGVMALAAGGIVKILWKSLNVERQARLDDAKTHRKELDACNAMHKAEMAALVERLIVASSTMTEEYHTLAERMTSVLESVQKRLPQRRTGERNG